MNAPESLKKLMLETEAEVKKLRTEYQADLLRADIRKMIPCCETCKDKEEK